MCGPSTVVVTGSGRSVRSVDRNTGLSQISLWTCSYFHGKPDVPSVGFRSWGLTVGGRGEYLLTIV